VKSWSKNQIGTLSRSFSDYGAGTVTDNRYGPLAQTQALTVFADSKGNFDGMNYQEYRKTIWREYEGYFERSSNSTFLRDQGTAPGGIVFSYPRYVDAVAQVEVAHLYNLALEDAYEKLRTGEAGSGLDLSVDLAEAHQVKHLVGSLPRLLTFWKKLAKGRDGDPIGLRTAQDWLTLQYGVKPLIESTYGVFDALMHRRTYSYQRVVGKSKYRQFSSKTFSNQYYQGSQEDVDRDFSQRGRVVMEFQVKPTWRTLLAGYTSLNPISIGWELVPYSFVVDWFINVGGYLRTMETALLYGQDFVRGCYTYTLKDTQQGWVDGSGKSGIYTFRSNANAEIIQSYKRRSVFGSFPLPLLPRFHVDLGSRQLLSAASLLRLLLPRGGR